MGLTREDAKEWQQEQVEEWNKECFYHLIDQIYNDHEEQIKIRNERIDAQRSVIIGVQDIIIAKDKKIQQLDDSYSSVVYDFESAVMEIEKLKLQLLNAHNDTGIPTYRMEQ